MSNRVLPPEKFASNVRHVLAPNPSPIRFIQTFFRRSFPDLGDKKPESRFNLFNSASQTFVIYTASFPESVPTVNSLLFTVFVVKNVIKIS